MNAGAYNGEMKGVVESVAVMDMNAREFVLNAADLQFGYRKTSLQESGYIITEVCLNMQPGDKNAIKAMMDDFSSRRISKQPLEMPSAGSMFKRPPGYFAGTLIEEAGLKGYKVGGAQVSPKHAGFVVNCGNATAADVLQLIADVRRVIMEKPVWNFIRKCWLSAKNKNFQRAAAKPFFFIQGSVIVVARLYML